MDFNLFNDHVLQLREAIFVNNNNSFRIQICSELLRKIMEGKFPTDQSPFSPTD